MSSGFTSVSSSLFLTGIFGIVKLLSALSFMFIFVHLRGNRFWLKIGSILCGVSMLILALSVHYGLPTKSGPGKIVASGVTTGGLISVSMVYIFAFSFGISLGPLSWNICSEIFPAAIKAQCCAITTCIQWLFQIVIAGITPHLLASAGWITYLIYSAFCAGSLIFVVYCVPETKDVKLGRDMDTLFRPEEATADGEIEEACEVNALLGRKNERVRRDSVGFSV
jgi:MFS family permease